MSMLARIDTNTSYSQSQPEEPSLGTAVPKKEADNFWSPPISPAHAFGNNDEALTRVTTDISISLKNPSPELEQDSEEFKRQAKEIKKDIRRISKYSSRHTQKRCKSPAHQNEDGSQLEERLRYEHEFYRQVSVQEGRDFLLNFLKYHFPEHLENITIKSDKNLEEIKMIGNEDLAIGVRQCRRLFNAPVISDRVGSLLWQELSQPDTLNHSHEFDTDYGVEMVDVATEVKRRRRTEELEERMEEYIAQRRQAAACTRALQQPQSYQNDPLRPERARPGRVRAHTVPNSVAEAIHVVVEQTQTSIPMEKRAIDGFLEGVKKSAVKGATQLAASLASGYT